MRGFWGEVSGFQCSGFTLGFTHVSKHKVEVEGNLDLFTGDGLKKDSDIVSLVNSEFLKP